MNRKLNEANKFTLVWWQDSDIPELIVDCSYAGKLMPKPAQDGKTHQYDPNLIFIYIK